MSGDFTPVSGDFTPIKAAAKLIFLTCGIIPKVKASQKINIMPYKNCTVELERIDPEMFTVPKLNPAMLQTQKKERREYWKRKNQEYRHKKKDGFILLREWVPGTKYLSRPQLLKKTANYIQELLNPDFMVEPQEMLPRTQKIDIKEMREYKRIKNEEYRNEIISGFNLLRKCVPGTARLGEIKLVEKTVKYIQELLNKIKEKESPMECTPLTLTGLGRDSVPKITVHHYAKEQDSALREPHSCSSELVKTFAITLMKKNITMDAVVQTTSEAEEELPEEELLPEEEFLAKFNSELLPEEKLSPAEEELITDFNLELLVP